MKVVERRVFLAPLCVASLLALPNQLAIWLRSDPQKLGLWLGHHLYDLGQLLALGLVTGATCHGIARFVPRPKQNGAILLGLASLLVGALSLPTSFEGVAERAAEAGVPYDVALWSLTLLGSATVPVAAWIGTWRRAFVVLPGLAAVALASINNFILDQDYLGVHLFVTLNALALLSAALVVHGPTWLDRPLRPTVERTLLAALIAGSLLALFTPSNRLRARLASLEGAPLARLSSELVGLGSGSLDANPELATLAKERQRWWHQRKESDTRPPGSRVLPERPIVLLLTVDCLRADVFFTHERRDRLDYFRELSKRAFTFTEARSAGSATVPSLSSLFAGKYYSELLWKRRSKRGDVWPFADESPRFPELLQRAGVRTVTVASKTWLQNEHGVLRGFDEQEDLDQNRKPRTNHVKLEELLPRLKEKLTAQDAGPLFLYAHAMDPHSPYDSGKVKRGNAFDRYWSEIDRVGKQLARFDDWLREQGLWDRTTLILTADHGEAFGEHGTTQHSKTLYDELVHVPLWIRVPNKEGLTVDEPVSLVDLGPTILDLFGQPVPDSYQGQSLAGFARGEAPELTRPVAAEGRLLQMMLFPNRKKAIYDTKRGISELYDLARDPTESDNLAEDGSAHELVLLRAFFDAHKNPAYAGLPPYRP